MSTEIIFSLTSKANDYTNIMFSLTTSAVYQKE